MDPLDNIEIDYISSSSSSQHAQQQTAAVHCRNEPDQRNRKSWRLMCSPDDSEWVVIGDGEAGDDDLLRRKRTVSNANYRQVFSRCLDAKQMVTLDNDHTGMQVYRYAA